MKLSPLFRWLAAHLDERQAALWMDAPSGCCTCGTGGPCYRGAARPVTRYLYADACGPRPADAAGWSSADWSSCSAHPLDGPTPVVDYGRDVVVTIGQTEADIVAAMSGPDRHYTAAQRDELLAIVASPNGWDALIQHLQALCPAFDLYAVSMEWADHQAAPFPPLKARGVLGDLLIHFPAVSR
jgi:hypothetical protein